MSGLAQPLDDSPRLLDAAALRRITLRLAHEIVERHPVLDTVVLVGIPTRGVPLARAVAHQLGRLVRNAPPVARARPERASRRPAASGRAATRALSTPTAAPAPRIDGAVVIVVDDVLFTGRTVRAALDALVDCGRPAVVEVLTLIDRGHRELPLRATYVGKNVPTALGDRVFVRLREVDGVDGAWLRRGAHVVNAILRGCARHRPARPARRDRSGCLDRRRQDPRDLPPHRRGRCADRRSDARRPAREPCVLCPGFIDLHAHLRQPGDDEAETLQSGSRAAAAGGFTHVVAMANTTPPIDTPERVAEARVTGREHAGVDPAGGGADARVSRASKLVDIKRCIEAGAVAISDDGRNAVSPRQLAIATRRGRADVSRRCSSTPRTRR